MVKANLQLTVNSLKETVIVFEESLDKIQASIIDNYAKSMSGEEVPNALRSFSEITALLNHMDVLRKRFEVVHSEFLNATKK